MIARLLDAAQPALLDLGNAVTDKLAGLSVQLALQWLQAWVGGG